MTEDVAFLHRRVTLLSRCGLGAAALGIALLLLALAGVPLVGFVGVAMLIMVGFTPKVIRDLKAMVRVLDGSPISIPVEIEMRSYRTGRLAGRDIWNVWADIYVSGGTEPAATVPIGAVLSGLPCKTRALKMTGRTAARALARVAPGGLIILDTPAGLLLPSGKELVGGAGRR